MSSLPFEFPNTESRYLARVRRAASAVRRRFGAHVPATDMVHEVMTEALSEQARTGSEARVFWRRLMNKVFDHYRREKVHLRMLERRAAEQRKAERKEADRASGEAEAIRRELHAAIKRAVLDLSPTDQEIWRRLEISQSYAEIARNLRKSPAAIKQAAYRIRAHVRNELPIDYRRDVRDDE
jgi:RNA polymerase sigma factor (sigma-70 family)